MIMRDVFVFYKSKRARRLGCYDKRTSGNSRNLKAGYFWNFHHQNSNIKFYHFIMQSIERQFEHGFKFGALVVVVVSIAERRIADTILTAAMVL